MFKIRCIVFENFLVEQLLNNIHKHLYIFPIPISNYGVREIKPLM
jgi:hypothetical protein